MRRADEEREQSVLRRVNLGNASRRGTPLRPVEPSVWLVLELRPAPIKSDTDQSASLPCSSTNDLRRSLAPRRGHAPSERTTQKAQSANPRYPRVIKNLKPRCRRLLVRLSCSRSGSRRALSKQQTRRHSAPSTHSQLPSRPLMLYELVFLPPTTPRPALLLLQHGSLQL